MGSDHNKKLMKKYCLIASCRATEGINDCGYFFVTQSYENCVLYGSVCMNGTPVRYSV